MRTLLLTLTTCLLVLPAHAKYSGGSGTGGDPYQIATAADLIALGETPEDYDKHFILTADIDLDPNLPGRKVFDKAVIAAGANNMVGWFDGSSFTGVFDGNRHKISHLTIKGEEHLGLFGSLLSGGEIRDLGIVDADITGSDGVVGALVGSNGNASWDVGGGMITRCYSTGSVSGNHGVGGLVGSNGSWDTPGCIVMQCYSTAEVSGNYAVGGLVGYNRDGDVTQCYSAGAVSGNGSVGGLVGFNGNGYVTQCYSTATVSGSDYVGGLTGNSDGGHIAQCHVTGVVSGHSRVGGLTGENYGRIAASYSAGEVRGKDSNVGGLVGYNMGTAVYDMGIGGIVTDSYSISMVSGDSSVGGLAGGNSGYLGHCYSAGLVSGAACGGLLGWNMPGSGLVTDCFWDAQASGQATSAGGTGKTTAEMQRAKTFLDAGWDFVGETKNGIEDIWWILEGKDYPHLWWEAAKK